MKADNGNIGAEGDVNSLVPRFAGLGKRLDPVQNAGLPVIPIDRRDASPTIHRWQWQSLDAYSGCLPIRWHILLQDKA